ncbi:MAG TPA: DUF433 domain-containing protein [Tepidisphaeraceae bacterium]|nr:DUF433 domain-containing protein [Tepidisphaeraceae bacterium]
MTIQTLPTPRPSRPLSAEDLVGDLIQPSHPLFNIIWINPQRMSGAPCFAGTRVPVQSLFDHLEAGDTLETFLDDFPGITRSQAIAVLELSRASLLDPLPHP